ncbi:MAG: hypothetical protein AAGA42_12105, partial [Actinomycetota bacterium]
MSEFLGGTRPMLSDVDAGRGGRGWLVGVLVVALVCGLLVVPRSGGDAVDVFDAGEVSGVSGVSSGGVGVSGVAGGVSGGPVRGVDGVSDVVGSVGLGVDGVGVG